MGEESLEIWRERGKRYPKNALLVMQFTHGKNSTEDLKRLMAARSAKGWLKFEEVYDAINIVRFGTWNEKREVKVRFSNGITEAPDKLLEILTDASIKTIRFSEPNPLNKLMSENQVAQKEIAAEIIKKCLTPEIDCRLNKFRLSVEGVLDTSIPELPGISFIFSYRKRQLVKILFDAWSGSILLDEIIQDFSFGNNDETEEIFFNAINMCLIKLSPRKK